jgi:hypothetical protein
VGSSTPYHGLVLIVTAAKISAGEELFFHYTNYEAALHQLAPSPHYSSLGMPPPKQQQGQGDGRGGEEPAPKASILPKAADYEKADQIVKDLWEEYQSVTADAGGTGGATTATTTTSYQLTDAQWIGT